MNEPSYLQLNLEEMVEFHKKLGDQVIIPYNQKVLDAWFVIRDVLDLTIKKIEEEALDLFLAESYCKLQEARTIDERRTILLNVYNYKRDTK